MQVVNDVVIDSDILVVRAQRVDAGRVEAAQHHIVDQVVQSRLLLPLHLIVAGCLCNLVNQSLLKPVTGSSATAVRTQPGSGI